MIMSHTLVQPQENKTAGTENLSANKGIEALKHASRIATEIGISDMTLDEINTEIAAARISQSPVPKYALCRNRL